MPLTTRKRVLSCFSCKILKVSLVEYCGVRNRTGNRNGKSSIAQWNNNGKEPAKAEKTRNETEP